ncbi:hypothetical protein ABEB36_002679 [Hypothenemus hampei]|uniref:Programmed cell death protein 2 C-terminal domain-containing protein n=1 Tax=Hypothenemus hampei TaxID=57062 RepID=A0ABD1F6M7_HYPHA
MAKSNNCVLLGYVDEPISERYKNQMDFTIDKIGGCPDYPHGTSDIIGQVKCNLCKQMCRLIVQIYAPIENCNDHRILYLFACISPSCWNKNESWTCLRIQVRNEDVSSKSTALSSRTMNSIDWCSEADDWGEEDNVNLDEENCNFINNQDRLSEDEEESSSFDESARSAFKNLTIDDKNANNGAQGGAMARLYPALASAEIEADESGEVVTVESPTIPKSNLVALFHGIYHPEIVDAPPGENFRPYFMSIYPEKDQQGIDNHVTELFNEYKKTDADFGALNFSDNATSRGEMVQEDYENSWLLHGDQMFHHFITKIKMNPEQILRYHREGPPLLISPLQEPPPTVCEYCKKELVFEFQLVPTIIRKLRMNADEYSGNRLDFGTVLVFTCQNSCWGPGDVLKEETVIVQKENL